VEYIAVEHAARRENKQMIGGEQRTGQYRFDWRSGPCGARIQRSGQTGRCDATVGRLRSKLIKRSLSENGYAEIQRRQEFCVQMGAGRQELRMDWRHTPKHILQPFFRIFHC
jgi:hypothetical protein